MPSKIDESAAVAVEKPNVPLKAKIEVGILGATGTVGQQFIALLDGHPWFRTTWLAASERSAGKRYGDLAWRLPTATPEEVAALSVDELRPGIGPKLVFSALDSSIAGQAEADFAAAGHIVLSNSRNHRMDPLVPLLIPEINPDHLGLLPAQRQKEKPEGRDCHQPELLDDVFGDCAGGVAEISAEAGAGDDFAGAFGRGISGRGVAGCDRERDSLHRRRRRKNRIGNAEDSGTVEWDRRGAASHDAKRDDDAGAGGERAHRSDFGGIREAGDARRNSGGVSRISAENRRN